MAISHLSLRLLFQTHNYTTVAITSGRVVGSSTHSPPRRPSFIYFESPPQELTEPKSPRKSDFSTFRDSKMAPVQGSKFAALSTPDDDTVGGDVSKPAKKAKQKQKNKNKPQPSQSSGNVVETKKSTSPSVTAGGTNGNDPKKQVPVKSSKQPKASTSATAGTSKPKSSDKLDSAPKTCPAFGTGSLDPAIPSSGSSPIQTLFIWSVSACYLFAFISFYYQIRGNFLKIFSSGLYLRYFLLFVFRPVWR